MTTTTIERRHTDAGRPVDSTRLRLGAGALVVGLLGLVPLGTLHPHQ